MNLSAQHYNDLKYAFYLLENPSLAIKIADLIGKPIEKAMDMLPKKTMKSISEVSVKTLGKATNVAIYTLKDIPGKKSSNVSHKFTVAFTGAVGGLGGAFSLGAELMASTLVMLRSIADIARSEGESLNCPHTKLACLQVFAMGSNKSSKDDSAESGYYAIRAMLAQSTKEAAQFLGSKKLGDKGAPIIIQLITKIAEKFSITVSEKAAAQLVPVIGSVGGAALNLMFLDHFQDMARGHFTMRRLEDAYGSEVIKEEYEKLRKK